MIHLSEIINILQPVKHYLFYSLTNTNAQCQLEDITDELRSIYFGFLWYGLTS